MFRRGTLATPPLSRARLTLLAAYLVVVLLTMMFFHIGLVPDVLIFVLLGAAVVIGQIRLFVRDWGVFLVVLIAWQHTSGLAQWAAFPLHMHQLIDADRAIMSPFLHGALPQVWLQQHLYHAHAVGHGAARHWVGAQWYDALSWVVYGLHFPEPLVVGLAIWLYDRALFRRFAAAFLLLAGMSFAVYVIYPAVPPWMAARAPYRAIPYVYNIFNEFNYWVLNTALGHPDTHLVAIHYDEVGAMPSLHAAFPLLSALYLRKAFGRKGLLMLLYGAVVWFAVVYMAEHWIIDVIVGLVFAAVSYVVVESVTRWLAARAQRRRSVEESQLVVAASTARSVAQGTEGK